MNGRAWTVHFAAVVSVAAVWVGSPAWACDAKDAPSVLDRVDRVLERATPCAAGAKCSRQARPVYEKLSGARGSPELPKDARIDASAGVAL